MGDPALRKGQWEGPGISACSYSITDVKEEVLSLPAPCPVELCKLVSLLYSRCTEGICRYMCGSIPFIVIDFTDCTDPQNQMTNDGRN